MVNISQSQLLQAKQDFRKFVWIIWRHLGLPDPTPMQYEMCEYLQYGPKRCGVLAFRGIGKSWITSCFVLWLLWRDPQLKTLVVSASKDRSDAFSTFTKRLIHEVPFLVHLRADPTKGQRDSNVQFDVGPALPAHAPSVKSVGVYGQMTGGRSDVTIIDDAEVPNNSETATQREKLEHRVSEIGGALLTAQGKAMYEREMRVIYLGTPQCEDSLYNKLPDKGYEIRVWPAEVPENSAMYFGRLAPSVQRMIDNGVESGTPTDPDRFSAGELAERRLEYGRASYRLQFMLDTSLTDELKYPLKTADLIVMPTASDIFPQRVVWAGDDDHRIERLGNVGLVGDCFHSPMYVDDLYLPYSKSIMYIDPSGRGKDQVGYAVVKQLNGMLIIRRWGALEGGYDNETLTRLATIAWEENVHQIVAEDNFGDGMWTQLFQPVVNAVWDKMSKAARHQSQTPERHGRQQYMSTGCTVENEKVGVVSKEVRCLEAIEPALSGHRIIIDESLVREIIRSKEFADDPNATLKSGFYQLTRLCKERGALKWDDWIDALAGAIRQHMDYLNIDVINAMASDKKNRLDNELEQFMESAGKFDTRRHKTWGGVAKR